MTSRSRAVLRTRRRLVFHLLELLAVPLRSTRVFDPARRALGALDGGLFRLVPPLRRQAWYVVLRLADPRG